MKTTEIKELATKELEERIDAESTNLTKLKLNHTISPLDNPLRIRAIRRDVARMKTELQMRSKAENSKE